MKSNMIYLMNADLAFSPRTILLLKVDNIIQYDN